MSLRVSHLRCEYRVDPQGIDEMTPRLSWTLSSDERGARQSAFQILVASTRAYLDSDRGDLWDTGRHASDRNAQIEYAGTPLRSRDRCHWKVRLWDASGRLSAWSEPASWTMGLLHPGDWSAEWIGLPESADPDCRDGRPATPRYLRRELSLEGDIVRATAYATALGIYELRINGERVGDQRLAPEWTNYHRRVQYQAFDVTSLLRTGNNAIGAILCNGWYCGNWQHWERSLKPIYGRVPCLLVQIEVELADGSTRRIISDGDWLATTHGPLRFAGIYEGESYDARLEIDGWDRAGTIVDSRWMPAEIMQPNAGQRVWQRSEPIRATATLDAVAITEPKPGVYVFDFGQNFAGHVRLRVREPAGTELVLEHNEMLNPDGTLYLDNLHAGHLSTGDRQIVRYTCSGTGDETFEPRFSYQGFRYVQVRGFTSKPGLDALKGVVIHSDCKPAGTFECSNPLVNRLVQNIQLSQRSNFMGVPTDCPQRDERCGYTGDANFFMPTAVYNADVAAFFHKWLVDLCQDSQRPDGCFADHAPDYGIGAARNVGWSDAGIICPHRMYRTYGDTRVIREHYAAMKRNIQFQIDTSRDNKRGPENVGNGDWLHMGGGASNEVIGTTHFAYCLRLMSEMAAAIGEDEDSRSFRDRADQVADAFAREFVLADGRIKDSSQTGYALAYTMGLVPEDRARLMRERFSEEIRRFDSKLATGFIGTPRLLPALHMAGLDDLAYALLLNESMPSWLFPVVHGATTIWERWNGWTPDGFADSAMNSFNHYAFGAVGEFLFAYIAGIRELEPGYRRFTIAPVVQDSISWARASYDSIQGVIRSEWRRCGDELHINVTVPANSTAVIVVPCSDASSIIEGGRPLVGRPGLFADLRSANGSMSFEIGSGDYAFSTKISATRAEGGRGKN